MKSDLSDDLVMMQQPTYKPDNQTTFREFSNLTTLTPNYLLFSYGVVLANDGESRWGSLTCMIESKYVGNQNVSFIVDQGHGRSWTDTTLRKVSADDRIYTIQTFAGNVESEAPTNIE